jgi:polar amino acid transport system substrate-binding protein
VPCKSDRLERKIMKKNIFLCFIIAILSASNAHCGDVITLRADIWEPYNGEPESANPGYMIEVAQAIFTKAGYSVDYQCKGWTWERSIEEAKQGRIDGIVGAALEDAPGFIFPEETFINQQMTFFVKKGNTWRYNGVASLEKIKLGTISGYAYDDVVDAYIEKNSGKENIQTIKNANALELNIKKLEAGRIDATIEDASVFAMKIASLGMKGKFEEAGIAGESGNITIAFTPAKETSKKYAEILSKGLKEMRASGELKKILDKYGLKE